MLVGTAIAVLYVLNLIWTFSFQPSVHCTVEAINRNYNFQRKHLKLSQLIICSMLQGGEGGGGRGESSQNPPHLFLTRQGRLCRRPDFDVRSYHPPNTAVSRICCVCIERKIVDFLRSSLYLIE